jgi:tRNA (adenine57-N1/adenine58-N1)-methyltransferase
MLRPSYDDIVREIKRATQIVYPKDAGYILMKLGVSAGSTVVEAGTGSGALTIVLALAVGLGGHVYSYERRPDVLNLAEKNLAGLGLTQQVTLKLRDVASGFDEVRAEALFLDLPNPWDYVEQARMALTGGGCFGCILPTTNQIVRLLSALEASGFGMIQVDELLLRSYKAVAARLRPMDRMVAHTGYLVFARALA